MTYEYEVKGRKITLEVDEDLVAVRYREPAPYSVRARVADEAGLDAFSTRIEIPEEKYTVLRVAQTPQRRGERHAAARERLGAESEVARVGPVFRLGEHHVMPTDRILVGFRPGTEDGTAALAGVDCTVVEALSADEYLVQVPEDADPLQVAAQLATWDTVDYAEPDFVTFGSHVSRGARYAPAPDAPAKGPTGTLGTANAPGQYAMQITRAVDAWALQMGSPDVTIAILDEGVDTYHEDLQGAVTGAFDGVDGDTWQEPRPWDAHGTACAGLAAGIHGNQIGIKGVGGGCSLFGVRIAYSPYQGADWYTTSSWIARAIEWCWQNGADVLSNSWGGGAPSSSIINAFERARTQGRGGKGCVIVVAAGNASGSVDFPGYLDTVLTVSASNEADEFKTKTSSDGESWWGSNFGPEVDLAAPGVKNRTTDNTGAAGYDPGHYVPDFNGTSSSTPLVAGAAGLVLSADPELTESEVRDLLKETADQVGALPYVGGHNDQFGHGRLNVYEAVNKVLEGSHLLVGEVKQVGSGQPQAAAIYLETDDGGTYLLRTFQGFEAVDWAVLEQQSLTALAPFVGQRVTVEFGRREESPHGAILWGAVVTAT